MTLRRNSQNLIEFKDAKWTAFDTIECTVIIDRTGEEVRFNACSYDSEDYGRELFEMLSGPKVAQVAECPPEEKEAVWASLARSDRNLYLKNSDWTQLPDVPEKIKAQWAVYRQALRDLPETEGFPFNVVFPTAPNGGAS